MGGIFVGGIFVGGIFVGGIFVGGIFVGGIFVGGIFLEPFASHNVICYVFEYCVGDVGVVQFVYECVKVYCVECF